MAATVGYDQTFSVGTSDPAGISHVTLVRLSSVTHAFNQSQRFAELPIVSRGTGDLSVTSPANANLAPPGPYMLFILNSAGVPSIAKPITLR